MDAASELAQEYNTPIILTEEVPSEFTNIPLKYGDCVYGEPDLERLMKNSTFTAEELKWLWTIWHNSVGPRLKYLFTTVVQYENEAAKNNGKNKLFIFYLDCSFYEKYNALCLIFSLSSKVRLQGFKRLKTETKYFNIKIEFVIIMAFVNLI